MLKLRACTFALVIAAALELPAIAQHKADTRDEFFWLGQINKATAVINTDEGLSTRRSLRASLPVLPRS